MTGEERVRKAIRFDHPDRVPIWYFNRDHMQGDILLHGVWYGHGRVNEWGYYFETLDDGTMGQPAEAVIPSWDDLETYEWPTLHAEERLANVEEFKRNAGGRYTLAALGISGFTVFTFLRGFENAVVDILAEPDKAGYLLDRIFEHETRLIELAARAGLHGFHFADDWGTQDGLIINPELWRAIFKDRYRRQFERAHELGLDVWFHCCGNIAAILPDFYEIGVDVMNISQPNVVDIDEAGRQLRGKQCFMVPISYQTVSISGTVEDIYAEARRLYDRLGTPEGGFIGYVEEYSCMGMTETNYRACGDAFRALMAGTVR